MAHFCDFEKLAPILTCFSLQITEKSEARVPLVSFLSNFLGQECESFNWFFGKPSQNFKSQAILLFFSDL